MYDDKIDPKNQEQVPIEDKLEKAKTLINKYNLNMMSRINFLLEYGTVEGIIFGEDDIDVNDDEFSKIEEDNLKLRLLYDLRTILENSSSSEKFKRIRNNK